MTESLFDALSEKAAEIIDKLGSGQLTNDEAYAEWEFAREELKKKYGTE